jgi:hypothetical protein
MQISDNYILNMLSKSALRAGGVLSPLPQSYDLYIDLGQINPECVIQVGLEGRWSLITTSSKLWPVCRYRTR